MQLACIDTVGNENFIPFCISPFGYFDLDNFICEASTDSLPEIWYTCSKDKSPTQLLQDDSGSFHKPCPVNFRTLIETIKNYYQAWCVGWLPTPRLEPAAPSFFCNLFIGVCRLRDEFFDEK